jgi:hypothetical protein
VHVEAQAKRYSADAKPRGRPRRTALKYTLESGEQTYEFLF